MPFRRGCSALTLSLGAGEREEPFRVGDFLRDALLLDILLLVVEGDSRLFRRRRWIFPLLFRADVSRRATRMGDGKVVETLGERGV